MWWKVELSLRVTEARGRMRNLPCVYTVHWKKKLFHHSIFFLSLIKRKKKPRVRVEYF